jgi:hypothetical protein
MTWWISIDFGSIPFLNNSTPVRVDIFRRHSKPPVLPEATPRRTGIHGLTTSWSYMNKKDGALIQ